jgi:voltage-gated potassium channel
VSPLTSDPARRLRLGLAAIGAVMVAGVAGYLALGFGPLDAVYQTVTTLTTVGFREVEPLDRVGKVFTIALILVGVGTTLYTFGVLIPTAVVDGELRELLGRRRMERNLIRMSNHVVVCGLGRVGRSIADSLAAQGREVVVIDRRPDRLADSPYLYVEGDATADDVLREAGIERAVVLVSALATDADNLFVTLSSRALRPDLFIVARAYVEESEAKLMQAGADRVVNPQSIGGKRMAAFVAQPHVAEFLDVVMHDGSLEFRLEEVEVAAGSPLADVSLRAAHIRDRTGALVLAMRESDGTFTTNPAPETILTVGQILIAIGTEEQLQALVGAAGPGARP